MNYKIRNAVQTDEKKICELFLEMLKTIYGTENVEGYKEGDLNRFWNGGEDRIFVAEDNKVIAFISVEVHREAKNYIYLDDFSVTENYRNKGIGSQLLHTAEAFAAEQNIPTLILHVEKINCSAMRFYERSGFSIYKDDGNRYMLKKDILSE